MSGHWTGRSIEDFVYRISSDFVLQIENKMDAEGITQSTLAETLGVTGGRVSQVLRNPGNLTLKKMVEYAKSMGMKVAVVAYDDDDPQNKSGPINSQIFNACWTKAGKPTDFFVLRESSNTVIRKAPLIRYATPRRILHEGQTSDSDAQLLTDLVWKEKTKTSTSSLIEVGAN